MSLFVTILIGAACWGAGYICGKMQGNKDCETCDALKNAQAECWELERKLHGMRSSNGRLGKELQSMAFRNSGFKAR